MADGFHGIESIFQAVGLHDRLVVRSLTVPGITVRGDFDCDPARTTVYKAAERYLVAAGMRSGLAIDVEKRIPVQAGLGGGSADAAAVLAALQALFGAPLDASTIHAIGASVGSDVPFFLGSGAALVTGKGETVQPIPARTDFTVLLVKPAFGSSTPDAYRRLDMARSAGEAADPEPAPDLQGPDGLEARYARDPATWGFFNSFQPVLDAMRPEYRAVREALLASGARIAMVSGSGSTVFGLFPDPDSAYRAQTALPGQLSRWPDLASGRVYLHSAAALACPLEVD